jgi:hypothetical protein
MCADDFPAFVGPQPSLALSPDSVGACWNVFDCCHAKVVPEAGNPPISQGPTLVERSPSYSSFGNLLESVLQFGVPRTKPHSVRSWPKEFIQRGNVIADQRALVSFEGVGELCYYLGNIDSEHKQLRHAAIS